MHRDIATRRVSQTVVVLGVLALAVAARAQEEPPPPEPVPNLGVASVQPMPGNGALLFSDAGDANPHLRATDTFGLPVEGTYVQLAGTYWAWRPSETLWPGSYFIDTTNGPPDYQPTGFLGYAFTVGATIDRSPPVLKTEPSLSLVKQSTDMACCHLWTDVGVDVGNCAHMGEQTTAVLDLGLSSSTGVKALSQYLFKVSSLEATSDYVQWSLIASLQFTSQAEEYCYEIEALPLFDAPLITYEDLSPRCVPHGALGALGNARTVLPDSFFDRTRCTRPPVGYEAAWCERNVDCKTAREPECVLFDHLCNGGAEPTWPDTGLAGDGGSSGTGSGSGGTGAIAGSDRPDGAAGDGGAGGAGAAGTAGMAMSESDGNAGGVGDTALPGTSQPVPETNDPGCGIARTGVGSRHSWASLLFTLAALLVMRRARMRSGA